MKNKYFLFIIVILLSVFVIILHLFALENVTIKREQAYLRSGPGSYYPPIATLPEGYSVTVIQDNDSWLKVKADT
ncbi:MAG TPA: SH3 domain-containing protein, partial [Candidatus Cloacimonetes bacterium]|nr:SH3 domain-containing protein [Candidatus Cloacimonadota bacterium]